MDRLSDLSDEVGLIVIMFVMKWNNHVKNNFDKFKLEEKLLLVCLYNFELGSKTTTIRFKYLSELSNYF